MSHRGHSVPGLASTPGGPSAPEVFLINLSMGDKRRPFAGAISPWGRLLDYLSVKYNLLFLVSAGNIFDDLTLPEFANMVALEAADAEQRRRALLTALREQQNVRTLLAPSEALNPLTIGALHHDDVVKSLEKPLVLERFGMGLDS